MFRLTLSISIQFVFRLSVYHNTVYVPSVCQYITIQFKVLPDCQYITIQLMFHLTVSISVQFMFRLTVSISQYSLCSV